MALVRLLGEHPLQFGGSLRDLRRPYSMPAPGSCAPADCRAATPSAFWYSTMASWKRPGARQRRAQIRARHDIAGDLIEVIAIFGNGGRDVTGLVQLNRVTQNRLRRGRASGPAQCPTSIERSRQTRQGPSHSQQHLRFSSVLGSHGSRLSRLVRGAGFRLMVQLRDLFPHDGGIAGVGSQFQVSAEVLGRIRRFAAFAGGSSPST